MTSQTQGIQQLLAAEKKAAEKVAEARKRKKHLKGINCYYKKKLKGKRQKNTKMNIQIKKKKTQKNENLKKK